MTRRTIEIRYKGGHITSFINQVVARQVTSHSKFAYVSTPSTIFLVCYCTVYNPSIEKFVLNIAGNTAVASIKTKS